MDANEYLSRVTPAAQRSRLAPFFADITELRNRGCTLAQVQEFLAANGVKITIAGLSKYIKRREEKGETISQIKPVSTTSAKNPVSVPAVNPSPQQEELMPAGQPEEAGGGEFDLDQIKKRGDRFYPEAEPSENQLLKRYTTKE